MTIGVRTRVLIAVTLPVFVAVLLAAWGFAEHRGDASSAVRTYLLIAGVAIIVATALSAVIVWHTVRPLRHLVDDAAAVADVRLPALVSQITSNGESSSPGMAPQLRLPHLTVYSGDEFGQIAASINRVQDATVNIADEQSKLLRQGIGNIFIELAQRNRTLLDGQISFIDELEASETDPDRLDHLFRLDHLATRMRRNAESLLVLAGADEGPTLDTRVDMADVLRVAQGEIADFNRVQLSGAAPGSVTHSTALSLAHLLSELMENAAENSPASERVHVAAKREPSGFYRITVSDRGSELPDARRRVLNAVLDSPPALGLSTSTHLGLEVVARLAQRLGAKVSLDARSGGGSDAVVDLPAALVSEEPTRPERPRFGAKDPAAAKEGAPTKSAAKKAAKRAPTGEREPVVTKAPTPVTVVVESEDPPAPLPSRRAARTPVASPPATRAESTPAATPKPVADPTSSAATESRGPAATELASRNPFAALADRAHTTAAPGASTRSTRNPTKPDVAGGRAAGGRTPEELRQMLSSYRGGRRKAEEETP